MEMNHNESLLLNVTPDWSVIQNNEITLKLATGITIAIQCDEVAPDLWQLAIERLQQIAPCWVPG